MHQGALHLKFGLDCEMIQIAASLSAQVVCNQSLIGLDWRGIEDFYTASKLVFAELCCVTVFRLDYRLEASPMLAFLCQDEPAQCFRLIGVFRTGHVGIPQNIDGSLMVTVSIGISPNIRQTLSGLKPDWAYWN